MLTMCDGCGDMPGIVAKIQAAVNRVFTSRVLRVSSVVFTGNTLALALSIATSIVLARILGPEPFGLVILAMTSVNVIIEFIDARTGEALIRFMGSAVARGERDEALTFFIVGLGVDALVSAAAVLLALALVPPVVGGHEQGAVLRQLVTIYLLAVPFALLQNTFESIFHTFKRFTLLTALNIGNNLFALLLLLALATQGIAAVTWGYVIAAVSLFVMQAAAGTLILVRQLRGARGQHYRAVWRQFWPFAFHTSAMGSLKAVASNMDVLLLGALRPVSEVTFYKLARSTVSLMALPVAPVSTVIYPLMNEAAARDDRQRVRYLIKRFMLYGAVISLATALMFLVLIDELVFFIYGADYAPVIPLVYILLIGTVLEIVMGWVRTVALIYSRPQLVTFSGFTAFVFRYSLALPLIYFMGAVGSAVGHTFGIIISVGVNIFYVLPRLRLHGYRLR